MGQALKKAAQNSSAAGSGKKLEYNSVNKSLLDDIIDFVESFPTKFPGEAKFVFNKPVSWETKLEPTAFGGGQYEQRGDDLVSNDLSKDEKPLLRLHKDANAYTLSVLTMEQLAHVLKVADGNKVNETRACLEANSDPLIAIGGDRLASTDRLDDLALYRLMDDSYKNGTEEETDETTNEKRLCSRVALIIRNFDTYLLTKFIDVLSSHFYLTVDQIETQVALLQKYSGEDEEKDVLEEITFTSDYKFENGCRTSATRQLRGDMADIVVKPHDTDLFYVVATNAGYFEAERKTEEKEWIVTRIGEAFTELPALIRTKSPKFGELFDKLDFEKHEKTEKEKTFIESSKDKVDGGDNAPNRHVHVNVDQNDNQKSERNKADKKKKLEPSLKWKNLGVEDDQEREEKEKKSSKKASASKKKVTQRSRSKAKTPQDEDSFSESSSESEEEEEQMDRRNESNSDLPSEYWQIQKLVKYLKGGNQTATIIALCSMRDFNLAQETCQLAIRDVGGLEVLINLLDTDEIKCKIGSLKILKEISRNTQIRRAIADLGGLQTMVQILADPNKELKCLAAETIANVAKFRRARRTVRHHGGIKKLVTLLDTEANRNVSQRDIDVARCGALALWSCSKSTKNKLAMRVAGSIPLLAKLLKSQHENMLIPVVGTLQECASEQSYRLAIRTEEMIEDLVKHLKSENEELQMHCASAIFKCAEEKETRDLVRQFGGLDPLVNLLNNQENKELLAAATGAIWKCAISPENVTRFQELKAIDLLVALLNNQPEEVLVNVVGALGECAQVPDNRAQIRKCGGISPLVNLLTGTNQALLVNVTKAVGACAEEPDNMANIDRLDGVRLLWSLLKNQNPEVQASAAWAICPCIENAKDAGEMVRSFVGGLELIVSLLKSEEQEVLASVCAAIANIAKDEENLAVITDHGVVPMLAKLTDTTDDKLRKNLAEAIARCCSWGNNRIAFGKEGAVAPLYSYLKSKDTAVHRSTARALFQLSKNPDNCITMHEAGVVKPLMEMVGSNDEVLQEAAAGCIGNIRRLALANEKAKYS